MSIFVVYYLIFSYWYRSISGIQRGTLFAGLLAHSIVDNILLGLVHSFIMFLCSNYESFVGENGGKPVLRLTREVVSCG